MQDRTEWSEVEINQLIELFPNNYNIDIAKIMNRSVSSIVNKSRRLDLKKNSEHKSKCISKRNKMVGRDINYDFVKQEALKYKSRAEFQIKDSSCYKFAREKGILEEVCSHMISLSYSIPQLILRDVLENILGESCTYNDRMAIKPYELDIYFEKFKLAFEYNGKGWHVDNKRDKKKIEICKKRGIKIIYIIENNRRYEEDVKNQIINNLETINRLTNKNIKNEDVIGYKIGNIYNELCDKEEIIKITKKYNILSDFIKNEPKLYDKLIRFGWLSQYTNHMIRKRQIYTDEYLKKAISNYTYLFELYTKERSLYLYIKRHKLSHLINHLKRK